jgi:hypothetical protein
MGQRAYGIANHDPAVIQNFLKFLCGLGALLCAQIRLATDIDRIKGSEAYAPDKSVPPG